MAPPPPGIGDRLVASSRAVGDLIANSLVFLLSRLASDGLSIYAFELAPRWKCASEQGQFACRPPASSSHWILYLLGLVPVTGLCKHLTDSMVELSARRKEAPPPGLHLVPKILNYVVGWSAGSALVQVLHELQHHSGCAESGNCTLINISFSLLCTLVAFVFIVLLKPYVDQIECGNNFRFGFSTASGGCSLDSVVDWIEDLLEDVLAMLSRGLTVIAMTLWVKTFSELLYVGVDPAARIRIAPCWALSTIFLGGHISVQLEMLERRFAPNGDAPSMRAVGALEFSSLLQAVMSFVAAWACNDVVSFTFPSLDGSPSAQNFAANLAVTTSTAVCCVAWLVATQQTEVHLDPTEAVNRDEAEKYYVTNGMAFFVGWNMFDLSRDLILLLTRFIALLPVNVGEADAARRVLCIERIGVLVCVPVFSLAAFFAALHMVEGYALRANAAAARAAANAAATTGDTRARPQTAAPHGDDDREDTHGACDSRIGAQASLMFKPPQREVLAGEYGRHARKETLAATKAMAAGVPAWTAQYRRCEDGE